MRRASVDMGKLGWNAALVGVVSVPCRKEPIGIVPASISPHTAPRKRHSWRDRWHSLWHEIADLGNTPTQGTKKPLKYQILTAVFWNVTGAVEKTRTSTGCPTATSTLRVYQFRHDRTVTGGPVRTGSRHVANRFRGDKRSRRYSPIILPTPTEGSRLSSRSGPFDTLALDVSGPRSHIRRSNGP